jgi:hypothetical protein
MKPADESKPRTPAPTGSPLDGTSDSGTSGSGAQTALLEMLRKRRMRASRDQDTDSDPPSELPVDDPSRTSVD